MEEKIKIHVTKDVYDIILKDTESFEFYKKDNISLNKNLFLTNLINNYYKIYQRKEENMINIIKSELKLENINDNNLAIRIVNKINRCSFIDKKEKFSSVLSLKPTKESIATLKYIESYLLNGASLSEFFRNMLTSYCSMPQDEREKIIFKEQYETIKKAINQNKKIVFTTTKYDILHEADPYAIIDSKEEMHCYLLAKYKGICKTYRLSRITNVSIIKESIEIDEFEKELFNKMIEHGPQFNYENNEETIIIKLTKKGQDMYKSYYVHRPKVDYIEGDYYYFSCSFNQLSIYFRRFGKEAFIVTPHELQHQFFHFYRNALNHYTTNLKKK